MAVAVRASDRTHQPWATCDPRAHQPWATCGPRAHQPWATCDPHAHQPWATCDPHAHHQPWAACDPHAHHQPWAPCDPRAHHQPWAPCAPSLAGGGKATTLEDMHTCMRALHACVHAHVAGGGKATTLEDSGQRRADVFKHSWLHLSGWSSAVNTDKPQLGSTDLRERDREYRADHHAQVGGLPSHAIPTHAI